MRWLQEVHCTDAKCATLKLFLGWLRIGIGLGWHEVSCALMILVANCTSGLPALQKRQVSVLQRGTYFGRQV